MLGNTARFQNPGWSMSEVSLCRVERTDHRLAVPSRLYNQDRDVMGTNECMRPRVEHAGTLD